MRLGFLRSACNDGDESMSRKEALLRAYEAIPSKSANDRRM